MPNCRGQRGAQEVGSRCVCGLRVHKAPHWTRSPLCFHLLLLPPPFFYPGTSGLRTFALVVSDAGKSFRAGLHGCDTHTGGLDAMTIWSTGPAEPQNETEASTPPHRNIPPSFSDSSKFEMSFLSSSIFSFLFFDINLFILCVRV